MRLFATHGTMSLLRSFSAMSLALGATVWVVAEDLPAQPPSSGSSASAPTRDNELDELWVGGWFSHNVLRIDWQTGESLGMFVPSGAWGPNAGDPADFDVNGLVGANDLLRLLASWGPCP